MQQSSSLPAYVPEHQSYGKQPHQFPRVNDLLLNTEETGSGGISVTRPGRGAGFIYRHRTWNFLRLPKLIFWGSARYHLGINLCYVGWELRVTTLFSRASQLIRDGPTQ